MEALEICRRPVVLFDFDGTVADTGRAVMTSTRKALAARGFSEAQMGDLRRMIGPPLWKSFHDFYGFSREESLVVADEYRAFFDELGPEEYPVFDGIPELLDGLVAQGKRLAVATSRMEAKCIDMVYELGLSQFEAVAGMNPLQGRETKADSVRVRCRDDRRSLQRCGGRARNGRTVHRYLFGRGGAGRARGGGCRCSGALGGRAC